MPQPTDSVLGSFRLLEALGLFRGEVVEDIPEGLRRWLAETVRLEAQT